VVSRPNGMPDPSTPPAGGPGSAPHPTADGVRDDLALFFSTSLDLFCVAGPEGRFLRLSPGWERALGHPVSEMEGRLATEFMHPDDVGPAQAAAGRMRREGGIVDYLARYRHRDGSYRWFDWRARTVGERTYASARDVTRSVELEEALRAREAEHRALFQAVPQPMWVFDPETMAFLAVNDAAVARYGWSREEFLSMTLADIRPPEDLPALEAEVAGGSGGSADPGKVPGIRTHRTKDGSTLLVEITSHPLEFRGRPARMALANDVSERMETERRLRLQGTALATAANAIVITDRSGAIEWTNPAFSEVTGYSAAEAVGRTPGELLRSGRHGPGFYVAMWETILAGRPWRGEMVNRRKDGSLYVEEQTITPVQDGDGTITHFVAIKQDVTERRRVEEALRESEARYHGVFHDSHAVMLLVDPSDRTILEANPAAGAYYGMSLDELRGMRLSDIEAPGSGPGDGGESGEALGARLPHRARHRVAGGEVREVEVYSGPVEVTDGRLMYSIVHDVTDRIRTEAQLRQAQKMESVGRLAGGVAHDFNNILTVINATAELAAQVLSDQDPLRGDLEEIRDAGNRAAHLTRQLLTFSRQEIAQRRDLDLNAVVEGMDRMLRRVIGEDVRITFRPAPGLPGIRADPGHIEQVVVNLAVNARDAMPSGGELIIETSRTELDETAAALRPQLAAGSYVILSISDTGVGMDRETQERMFEPFFSTKAADVGTGLGLSTVYGIVQESGGEVMVYSEPGEGTTIRVYLPAMPHGDPAGDPAPRPGIEPGSEAILLVEDDAAVRDVTARVLRAAGYTVTEAGNGVEALERFKNGGAAMDLVLTDLVMPGISGDELARELDALAPGVRILFTSGHTSDALMRRKLGEHRVHFVGKPYTAAELTRGVRKVLDE
jgi:two-component system, cell cycle sensor histidine kinase and response regulator CckA